MKRIALSLSLVALLAGCSGGGDSSSESGSTAAGVSASGSFTSGADLKAPRAQHSATVLQDGRVLVVGGTDGTGILADSELFDPLTGSWELVRNMHANPNVGLMMAGQLATARQLHSATLMQDGRVLIAGGVGIERLDFQGMPILETLQSAFVFDPQSNTFQRVADLNAPRAWQEATLLSDGRVLLAGGLDAGLRSMDTAEIFDPKLGRFIATSMIATHTWGSAVTIGNQALVAGGADVSQAQAGGWAVNGVPQIKAERILSNTSGFSAAGGEMTSDRVHAAGTATPSGAFFAGGQVPNGGALTATNTTERYNVTTDSFEAGPTLSIARFGARAVAAGNSVLIIGGLSAQGTQLATCEIYDNVSNTMVGAAQMLTARSDFQAVRLLDGRILVTGGMDAQNMATARTELYR